MEQEWAYPFKFDYIICRYMAGSLNDWDKLAERIYEYVDELRAGTVLTNLEFEHEVHH